MKNSVKTIIIISILSCASVFADDVTSTTSSVTSTSGDVTNKNGDGNTTTRSSITHSTTTTTAATVSEADENIISTIYAKYAKDSALIGTSLTVNCQNGVVTLNGSVTAQSQADEAVIVAKSINGVKDVRSSVIVTTNPHINAPAKSPNY